MNTWLDPTESLGYLKDNLAEGEERLCYMVYPDSWKPGLSVQLGYVGKFQGEIKWLKFDNPRTGYGRPQVSFKKLKFWMELPVPPPIPK